MPAFTVDLDALDEAIQVMEARSAAIAAQLDTLDGQIGRLHDVWTGEAAAAQLAAHRQWLAGAKEMREGLDAIRAAARTAHGNYSAAVTANLSMWS